MGSDLLQSDMPCILCCTCKGWQASQTHQRPNGECTKGRNVTALWSYVIIHIRNIFVSCVCCYQTWIIIIFATTRQPFWLSPADILFFMCFFISLMVQSNSSFLKTNDTTFYIMFLSWLVVKIWKIYWFWRPFWIFNFFLKMPKGENSVPTRMSLYSC